jgi:single-strand DNA-binding protein
MLNKIQIIGRLGRDVETRNTESTTIAKFSVATTEKYKDQELTEWHNCVAFGRLAEICGEYLQRGQLVYVEGRIQTNEWSDKKGFKHKDKDVIVAAMKMLDRPGQRDDRPQREERPPTRQDYAPPAGDDDIPF